MIRSRTSARAGTPLVHEIVEQESKKNPDALALVHDDACFSFGEINVRANRLANRLLRDGMSTSQVVAVHIDTCAELVIAIIGVMKAGAACQIVDPSLPRERKAALIADAGARIVLTTKRTLDDGLPSPSLVDDPELQRESGTDPALEIEPHALAFLFYTAGSTGEPKGVLVDHARMTFALGVLARGVEPADRMFAAGPLSAATIALDLLTSLSRGASVVLPRFDERKDAGYLSAVVAEMRVTQFRATPGLVRAMMNEDAVAAWSSVRRIYVGGEASANDLADVVRSRSGAELYFRYGLTECGPVCEGAPEAQRNDTTVSPLGKPLPHVRTYVLDEQLKPVAGGALGDLYVGGPGLARGYFARPAATAERFVPDPFCGVPGERMYQTGDLVRRRADGVLEHHGRLDRQVKIRGMRVEPAEIEGALQKHSSIRECAVDAIPSPTGANEVVAFYVLRKDVTTTIAELRAHCTEELPPHLVPTAFVRLDALPRLPAGKVDRAALRKSGSVSRVRAEFAAPQTPLETALAEIWSEVLKVDRVGIHDDFFALGGHSLIATQVVSRVRRNLRKDITVRALFDAPTVAALADLIGGSADSRRVPHGVAADPESLLPLSYAQERLWFLEQLESLGPTYNVPVVMRFRGDLRISALQRALDAFLARHDALRLSFEVVDGKPFQRVGPPAAWTLRQVELRTGADADATVRKAILDAVAEPFDIVRGPLLRSWLYSLAPNDHVLLVVFHHIISDAWSNVIVRREVATLYEAFRDGRVPWLPELSIRYVDWAQWQRESLSGAELERQLGYWTRELAGVPPLELPTDRPRPVEQTFRGRRVALDVPLDVFGKLGRLGTSERTTLFMTLVAAFEAFLSRHAGQSDFAVGTSIANRTRAETELLVGFFANTLALRAHVPRGLTFRELLADVRERTLRAYDNQDAPFEKVVEAVNPPRDMSRSPLFQVMFIFQNVPFEAIDLGALTVESVRCEIPAAHFDVSVTMFEAHGGLSGHFDYNSDLFDEATVERMVEHFGLLLNAVASDPDAVVDELPIVTEAERAKVLVEWNATATRFQEIPVHRSFERHAVERPEAIAVVDTDGSKLTYGRVDARATALSRELLRLGVGVEARAVVWLERSADFIVAALAVLKAGAAYVPVDAKTPHARAAQIIANASSRIVVSSRRIIGAESVGSIVVYVDDLESDGVSSTRSMPSPACDLRQAAYLIYTSGTTGTPKGIVVQHRALVNVVTDHVRRTGITAADRVAHGSTVAFDASMIEIWPALTSGATLFIVDEETRLSTARLIQWFTTQGITVADLPSVLAESVLDTGIGAGGLRVLTTGGDALKRRPRRQERMRVLNCYGPTETTVQVTVDEVEPGVQRVTTIGRPIQNTSIYVLDAHGEPTPIGVYGEIFVGGANVARGYFGKPELTAAQFVPDPFANEPGARMYRTGDRGRWLEDGRIAFGGRTDAQVKIRGFRIELGEIEDALVECGAVREAVVVAREHSGDKRLVAYVTSAEAAFDVRAIREALQGKLPEYMVPSAFVRLDELPLSATGKVDRAALPAPDFSHVLGEYVPPSTAIEKRVAEIWRTVLDVGQIGRNADFFEVGGHSLLATQVMSRVRTSFGLELPVRALFETRTVERFAQRIESTMKLIAARAPSLVPRSGGGPARLSYAQERLWFLDRLDPGTATYNMPTALRLRGKLDVSALERAIAALVQRHDSLRTIIEVVDGQPIQSLCDARDFTVEHVDIAGEGDIERRCRASVLARAVAPFDLARGPLFRASLFKLGAEDHALVLVMHHIVSDGWSMGILSRELRHLYDAFRRGQPSSLPRLVLQYADYASWQRDWLVGAELDRQLNYWKQQLTDAPALDLPTDRPRPPLQTFRGAALAFDVPENVYGRLLEVVKGEGATAFMGLLAAFQVLLARHSGQSDFVIGTPIANRTRSETEAIVGFFVNTLALRTDLDDRPTFRELLRRVKDRTLSAYAHQDAPFEKVVEAVNPPRDLSRSPLFQVMFVFQNVPSREMTLGSLDVRPFSAEMPVSKFDLSLAVLESRDGLVGRLEYNTDLFDRKSIEGMAARFRLLLRSLVAAPDIWVGRATMLPEEERRWLLSVAKPADRPELGFVHELIAKQADARPEHAAIIVGSTEVSFGELEKKSNAIAAELAKRGVRRGDVVALRFPRGAAIVISALAVMKTGAAYVPIDTSYPAERIAFMLEDSRARVVVSSRELWTGELPGADVLFFEEIDDAAALPHPAPNSLRAHDAAYVIYTSGTTGKPKGSVIEHAQLANLVHWRHQWMKMSWKDRAAQLASPGFDSAVLEIWPALACGATLVVPDDDTRALPEALRDFIVDRRLSVVFAPTPLAEQLLALEWPSDAALRWLTTGGDRLTRRPAPDLPFVVINEYGPTECTVASTAGRVESDGTSAPGIGRPILHARTYVLDADGQLAPIGAAGELFIGGDGVGRGYLRRPEMTAERFVPDPFAAEPGARMYRTGDRVRWHPSGELEFLGRVDHQVKVRGFRIELGEIETVLVRQPSVSAAVVVVLSSDGTGDKRLVAYVVPKEPLEIEPLREVLRRELPEYMVPAAFVVLDALPLTSHGKVDRRALPAPDFTANAASYEPPTTPIERAVAEIWQEVLRVERVGLRDHFFELGGHSLLATQVVSRVRATFDLDLAVRTLFEAPTLSAFVQRIEASTRDHASAGPPIEAVERTGFLPASYAQERLWFLDRLEPGGTAYNIPRALRLRGEIDVAALERAVVALVERHEALRTTFEVLDGEPRQYIRDVDFRMERVDIAADADAESSCRSLIQARATAPFDLRRGPLFRASLLKLGPEDHVLLIVMHHIVSDGWSMGIISRELAILYDAFRAGKLSPLPSLKIQYADYASWQRRSLTGAVLAKQVAHWKDQLANVAPLELPTDRPRPAVQSSRGATLRFEVSARLYQRVLETGKREGATAFMTLLAAFEVLLARHSGQDDFVVGTPIANRTRAETEGVVGFFVNTLALRTDLGGRPTFREVLRRVKERTLAAYAYQDAPFEKVVEAINPVRDLSRAPLFQVMFAFQNVPAESVRLGALSVEPYSANVAVAQFDLALTLFETGSGLGGGFEYNTDIFDAATVESLVRRFERLLESVVANPDELVTRLTLTGDEERRLLLGEWMGHAEPVGDIVHRRFEQRARAAPDAVAVRERGLSLTYRQLDERAEALAHALRSRGVAAEKRVVLWFDRSIDFIVAAVAVLKAGGAYVPLDSKAPRARVMQIIADANATCVIAGGELADGLRLDVEVFSGDDLTRLANSGGARQPLPACHPDQAAYVIYTSGTTGTPKGVVVQHRNLANVVSDYVQRTELTEKDRVAHVSSIAFDASMVEIWPALSCGATLSIVDDHVRLSPVDLLRWMREEKITVSDLPTVLAEPLLELDWTGAALRYLSIGGEALKRRPGRRTSFQLLNCYGPTETTVQVTAELVGPGSDAPTTIGRPIRNTTVHVLDPEGEPTPIGVYGEICVGGSNVARGYFARPELTAEKFIPDPFATEHGTRLYRTGDRGRWLRDGTIEFAGRTDSQLKLRGFRIELGEIENVLADYDGVRTALVIAREDVPGQTRLVAYLAASNAIDVAGVRDHLRTRLPDYMVPSAFVVLDSLPVTTNGKFDRKALPPPDSSDVSVEYVPPGTAAETEVARLWCEVLKLDRVSIHTNFFDLGGHSLLAAQLVARLRQVFDVDIGVRALFEEPTVSKLAARLTVARPPSARSPLTVLRKVDDAPHVVCVHSLNGDVFSYVPLARALEGLDVGGLRALELPTLPETVSQLAEAYVEHLLRGDGQPLHVCGWSAGGLFALELANQLETRGHPPSSLVLLDSYLLLGRQPREQPDLLRYYDSVVAELTDAASLAIREEIEDARRAGRTSSAVTLAKTALATLGIDEAELTERLRVFTHLENLARVYSPSTMFRGRTYLLSPQPERAQQSWRGLLHSAVGVTVPGDHFSMLRADVDALAKALRPLLDAASAREPD